MTDEHKSKKFTDKGLQRGSKAPNINTKDIYGNEVILQKLLQENNSILIDFFRGAW